MRQWRMKMHKKALWAALGRGYSGRGHGKQRPQERNTNRPVEGRKQWSSLAFPFHSIHTLIMNSLPLNVLFTNFTNCCSLKPEEPEYNLHFTDAQRLSVLNDQLSGRAGLIPVYRPRQKSSVNGQNNSTCVSCRLTTNVFFFLLFRAPLIHYIVYVVFFNFPF